MAETQKVTSRAVDFTNVKDGSDVNPKRQPAGDYAGKVVKVFDSPSKKDNVFQWCFIISAGTGTYPYYCKLQENQLWKLRNLFIAAGMTVPKKKIKVDPTKVVGKTIGLTLGDDEYQDKLKSVIEAVFPASDLGDAVAPDEEEDYEDEEEDEEEVADEAADDEEEEEEDAEEEEEEEEEEEPEPTPPPRRAKKAVPAARRAPAAKRATARRSAAPAVTDDELEELDIDEV